MRALLHPVFLVSVALFLAHQWAQWQGYHSPFLDSYLDDFLCLPVVLTLALAFLRVVKARPQARLHWGHVLFALVQVALTFELLLPKLASKYHADLWDLLAYVAGTVVWWVSMNMPVRERTA